MQRSKKYLIANSWVYTARRRSIRKKIKRELNKKERRAIKEELSNLIAERKEDLQ